MESTEVSFSPKDVMTLRQKTGLGMMDCKKALAQTNGDMAAAEEWLRAQRKGKMDTRTERTTGEGRIGIAISGSKAAIVEVRTETDFTAKNDGFVAMTTDVANEAVKLPTGEIAGPNDAMTKRIDDLRITTGENVNLARGVVLEGGNFGAYVHHDGKRAALIQIEGSADAETLKGICQHIVFHDPLGISEADVPADKLSQIQHDAVEEAKQSGKPEQIAQKIAEGKVRKYLEDNTLLHQKYVLDESKTIKELLPKGVAIKRFVRYTLGTD
ncbi:MAG TPA: translation elongation factor Ts [Phycisphaerales bacterium]|nr:translation elongation factor Ts [Phycisphaerales bacterium]HRQ76136.1 translation elongation factor Ts [Phycisphaerales bacterium]